VQRERLFRLLDRGRDYPIVWISGPPGSGKTALAASYLDTRKIPCLWYQVDERDDDPATFFYYMGMAAKQSVPRIRKPLPLLKTEYLAGLPAFSKRYFEEFYNRVASIPGTPGKGGKKGSVLVLDDYHSVSSKSAFHDAIIHGLETIPEEVNVFVLSRSEPPSGLSRLVASGKVFFLGWDKIRFNLDETRDFLRLSAQDKTVAGIASDLYRKTDGWAAGIVLGLLGLSIGKSEAQPLSRISDKRIFDYFATEILEKLEAETRDFLFQTAVFERVTVPMAESLTGAADAGRILANLSDRQCFVEAYAQEPPAYRYHPLFREFLLSRAQARFSSSELSEIRRKAALISEGAGLAEEAVTLFREAGDWDRLVRVVSSQAGILLGQGRNRTIEEWISPVPEEVRKKEPWLLYWLGLAVQPFRPAEGKAFFEEAFRLFEKQGAVEGTLLAWSAAVDSIVLEWNGFTVLDPWITWLDGRMKSSLSLSRETEARVAASMSWALLYRQPHHPDIRGWMERALLLTQDATDINLRMQALLSAVNFYAWTGDLSGCRIAGDEIREMARSPGASPLLLITWKWIEALTANRTAGASETALKSISEGLQIGEKHGIHVWDQTLFSQGVYAAFNRGDLSLASDFIEKMEAALDRRRRHGLCHFEYLSAWRHLLAGSLSSALAPSEAALKLAEETGMPFTRIQCHLLAAQVYSESGDQAKADRHLSQAKAMIRQSGSPMLEYLCLIKEAQFAGDWDTGEPSREGTGEAEDRKIQVLRSAMELGRKHGYAGLFPWWQPSAIALLCAEALEAGIEEEYVKSLIRAHRLVLDEPPVGVESWPWPLRIRTLGKFEITTDDKPIPFTGKVQKKPLALLKALVAQGGKGATVGRIEDWLWPEADGDLARNSFKAALSRLRKLLGSEDVIELCEGTVILNPRLCWVDAWAFEKLSARAEVLLGNGRSGGDLSGKGSALAEKALALYKGPFLPGDESEPWTEGYGDLVRGKFLRLLFRFGEALERHGLTEKAVEYYQRVLDIEEASEEIYQHLMAALQKLGRRSEAVAVYRRCQSIFTSRLGRGPSTETETLYRSLLSNTR
jgi:ATP/maltotriose-dependent transcriptional regulator MalT/DNA-binding SARP family transcriptional activator